MFDEEIRNLILYSIIPIGLSVLLIVTAFKPELFIREEKRYMFIKYRFAWVLAGGMLLAGNLVRLALFIADKYQ